MLDTDFWKKYFITYDILNIVIPYVELLKQLVENLQVKENDTILDAGAGTGNLTLRLKARGARVIALDSSEEGLQRLQKKDANIEIVKHNLENPLPFPENYFDKIVSNNVIYTIPSQKRKFVFDEFYRILKPGGRIVISNIRKGWKPVKIYFKHLVIDSKRIGFLKLLLKIIKMIGPTVKIFYYNRKIQRENRKGDYDFVEVDEQRELLESSGFIEISKNISVYANQAILNSAIKSTS